MTQIFRYSKCINLVTLFIFYEVSKWEMYAFFSVLLPKIMCLLKSMFKQIN